MKIMLGEVRRILVAIVKVVRANIKNKESTSTLAMCKLELSWQISSANWNESLAVYSLSVEGVKTAVKTLFFL